MRRMILVLLSIAHAGAFAAEPAGEYRSMTVTYQIRKADASTNPDVNLLSYDDGKTELTFDSGTEIAIFKAPKKEPVIWKKFSTTSTLRTADGREFFIKLALLSPTNPDSMIRVEIYNKGENNERPVFSKLLFGSGGIAAPLFKAPQVIASYGPAPGDNAPIKITAIELMK